MKVSAGKIEVDLNDMFLTKVIDSFVADFPASSEVYSVKDDSHQVIAH